MIDLNGYVGWPSRPSCSRCKCRTNDICSGIHIGQELRYCEAERAPTSMKNVSKSRIDVLQSKLDGELLCQLEIHCVYKIFLGSRGVCVHAHRPQKSISYTADFGSTWLQLCIALCINMRLGTLPNPAYLSSSLCLKIHHNTAPWTGFRTAQTLPLMRWRIAACCAWWAIACSWVASGC